jgi:polyvinyl alcohol dehydrogenase (cytochrome)
MLGTTLRRLLAALGVSVLGVAGAATPVSAATSWYTYHGDTTRQGVDAGDTNLGPSTQAWRAGLDGAVYGQPVIEDGRIFAATEDDTVYALDGHDGHVLWSTHVGTPLTGVQAATGCGDVDPLGITSTPAIDPATGTVYVVAEVASGSGASAVVHHQLIGLDPYSGAPVSSADADPPVGSTAPAGQDAKWLQQRAALAVANGRVYVAYGGLSGDCGVYHGWVVGIDPTGSHPAVSYDVTPDRQGGAIWGPSGPAIDASGNVYVSTGNPNNPADPPVDDSESVVKLSPDLGREAAFRDTRATGDADLATNGVTVLPDGDVFAVGKTDVGYVLRQSDLSEVAAIPSVCGGDPDGGNAYVAATNTLYVPCRGSSELQAVDLANNTAPSTIAGVNGPPIYADGHLWAAQYGASSLYELTTAGTKVQTLSTGSAVPTFGSPSAGDGLVVIGTTSGVTAFAGPGGPPPAAPPAPAGRGYLVTDASGDVHAFGGAAYEGSVSGPLAQPVVGIAPTPDHAGYWLVAADGGVFSFGDAAFHGSLGNTRLAAPIVGMVSTADGGGYWLVGADGGVFSFGDAVFHGSEGNKTLAKPVVGMARSPGGGGYWLVASDGGIFNFGDAAFAGSLGNEHLAAPIVGMTSAAGEPGYRLVGADGGVFSFGGAPFYGSEGNKPLAAPVTGLAATRDSAGYWLVGQDGGIFTFGDAGFAGSLASAGGGAPAVGIAAG